MPISITEFLELRKERTIVDVRSEGEYAAGHIPGVFNIPVLNNSERIIVGTAYKQQGQKQAIKEGFRLVGPRLLDIITETEKIAHGKELLIHCWRGGMRSNNFCQFVGMAGVKTQALAGGYKAYRQKAFESFQHPFQFIVLSGYTGSGKSEVLRELKTQGEQVIDLEMLAHHKGSAFGGLMMPAQPTTEQFQNHLFEEILQLDLSKRIWIEDESISLGKIFLPPAFWMKVNQGPLVNINVDKDIRISRLVNEYGAADKEQFLLAMSQITSRLGGQHFKAAKEKWMQGDMAAAIAILLTYYDKAYLKGIEKRKDLLITSMNWDGAETTRFVNELMALPLR